MARTIHVLPRLLTQRDCIVSVAGFAEKLSKKTNLSLLQVWLFGSYAKGEQQEFSDIDVAVVANEFEGVGFLDVQLFTDILIKFPLLEPHTYNTSDFINHKNPFAEHIQQTDIQIF